MLHNQLHSLKISSIRWLIDWWDEFIIELQLCVSVSLYVFFPTHCKYCMLFVHQHRTCLTMCINCTLHQFGLQGGCPSNHRPYYFQIGSAPRFKLLSCFVRRHLLRSLLTTKWGRGRNMFWGQKKLQPQISQRFGRKKFRYLVATCISPVFFFTISQFACLTDTKASATSSSCPCL